MIPITKEYIFTVAASDLIRFTYEPYCSACALLNVMTIHQLDTLDIENLPFLNISQSFHSGIDEIKDVNGLVPLMLGGMTHRKKR